MGQYKRYWFILIGVLIIAFTILGLAGAEVYRSVPPIPKAFVDQNGKILMTKEDILKGQTAWQTTGGMEIGSIWGHGAYQAPDWTADWLHRELTNWLNIEANAEFNKAYTDLDATQQAMLKVKLKEVYRGSKLNSNDTVTLPATRIQAIQQTAKYYISLYGNDPQFHKTREAFAMQDNVLPSLVMRTDMSDFFFWTAWAASADRPGTTATYTNNWPHEPFIDNVPTAENIMWSALSVILLIAGIGLLIWGWAFSRKHTEEEPDNPKEDPILKIGLTPSQKALWKYLAVVVTLFVVQVILGAILGHYTVEGQDFYGIPLSKWLPYSLARTWHLQTALFWIATAFLAAGLFLAPIINGGKDPKFQRFGVNFLFIALLIVVVGSFIGNYLAINHILPTHLSFMLGIQGYEYLDLGRAWQLLLFVGFIVWLALMMRAVIGAFRTKGDKNMLAIFIASVVAVGLFYAPGLFYGEHTPLPIMEYWRWWVVHLWVEGFFEVFATAAIAFIFTSMGLIPRRTATIATLSAAVFFMIGGIPGTFHHLYFSGTTTPIMAIGATFSALEVVPLVIIGYEAFENWRLQKQTPWMAHLAWPIKCFVAVAFWNLIGAGVFGFMLNPPLSLFYIQGLNTTAVHSHAALFGVYGFLAIGFVLLILRYLRPDVVFNDKLMKFSFWALNLGIVLMIAISLLPIGIYQAYASITQGLWYARSEGFMQQDFLQLLRWLRVIGDIVFIAGVLGLFWLVVTTLLNNKSKSIYK